MRLFLSRHGIWYYRKSYLLPSGKRKEIRKSLATKDKYVAKRLVAAMDANRRISNLADLNQDIPPPTTLPPLKVCIQRYLSENSHLWQPVHQARISKTLNQLPQLNTTKAEVSTLKELWLKDKSIVTVNKLLRHCSLFLEWAQVEYDGVVNNFEKVRLKGHVEKSRRAYTKEELDRLSCFATQLRGEGRESHFWFLMLGRYTGMRANEICQLTPRDVDRERVVFNVRGKVLKNKNAKRLVPIHPHLVEAGLYDFAESRSERLMENWKESSGSFAPLATKWFALNRKRYGLPDYHSLRHTVATELKSAGVPLQFCAAILGHANGSITFDRYGHDVAIEKLHAAMAHVGKVI